MTEPIFHDIDSLSWASIKDGFCATQVLVFSLLDWTGGGLVEAWEHIFWSINILDKLEIVNFFGVALIKVLSWDKFKDFFIGRHEIEHLKDSWELESGHMATAGLVKILEGRFQKNSIGSYKLSYFLESINHRLFFLFSEVLYSQLND